MKRFLLISTLLSVIFIVSYVIADEFNGLGMSLGNLSRVSKAKTRSISAENFTGEKGKGGMANIGEGIASHAARDLGQGWKVNPYIRIKSGKTFTLAEIEGPETFLWSGLRPAQMPGPPRGPR